VKQVKLFEQVRNSLASFDATKLTREDLMARLQKVNAEAEQLLKTAHALKAPEIFAKTHNRRLLSYELFLQATTLLMQWVEQPDDLTRRRSVVLYEFARTELEQVWKEEQRLR
jgi:L-rhamnose mutarotase